MLGSFCLDFTIRLSYCIFSLKVIAIPSIVAS